MAGKLTVQGMKALKDPGRYTDGRGLMLVIGKDGSRKWVLRIQKNTKRRDIGLGPEADVSLAEARRAADELRRAIWQGRDPVEERKTAKKVEKPKTFIEVAKQVHSERGPSWRNDKHRAQWISSLDHVKPLHNKPVREIDASIMADALRPIWLEKPETARRVKQRVCTILDYAHAKVWRDSEAPVRAVRKLLATQPGRTNHHAALPWQDLPAFIAGMQDTLRTGETVQLALEFIILTAARSGEVRGMRWSEIDLENRTWAIPAERMKMQKSHRVPLSLRAIAILTRMEAFRNDRDTDPLVFEGQKAGKQMSDMTLSMPLRRSGLGFTIHGFRSSFRDWCSEATNTPREIAEACLAHVVRNKAEAAYARSDHFEKRRAVMENWAGYICGGSGNVVSLAHRAAT